MGQQSIQHPPSPTYNPGMHMEDANKHAQDEPECKGDKHNANWRQMQTEILESKTSNT